MKNIELKTLGIQEMDKDEMQEYSGGFVGKLAVTAFGIGIIALAIAIWGIWVCIR